MKYAPIEEAIDAIARGEFLIVVDHEDRENEGDLILAAEKVTPEAIAFMVRYTSGLICMPVVGERLDDLQLPLMVADNTDIHRTSFTVSVDYTSGTTTGISAEDRASTIKAMIDPAPDHPRWPGPDTCSPFATARVGSSGARAIPRRRLTSPVWPAYTRPGSCARSSTTTEPWHGEPISSCSPRSMAFCW